MRMKWLIRLTVAAAIIAGIGVSVFLGMRAGYPRPHREVVAESGLDSALVYAVMRTESGFDEDALSRAGAVGLMQIKPSTAEFICEKEGIAFEAERLTEGEYNVRVGCLYLKYLLGRFAVRETALAAYNAGEGTVREWLADKQYSDDGISLKKIPYPETKEYLKKVERARKNYEFFY